MKLRVEYKADDVDDNVTWNPENFHIWLNGLELDLVSELRLAVVNGEGQTPVASIIFTPSEIEIDADTISALTALLEAAPEISEPDEE